MIQPEMKACFNEVAAAVVDPQILFDESQCLLERRRDSKIVGDVQKNVNLIIDPEK